MEERKALALHARIKDIICQNIPFLSFMCICFIDSKINSVLLGYLLLCVKYNVKIGYFMQIISIWYI